MVVVKFCLTLFTYATCKCQLEFLTRTKLFSSRRHVLPFVTTIVRQKEWFIFSKSSGQIETYVVRKPSHPCGKYEINYSNRKIKMNFRKTAFDTKTVMSMRSCLTTNVSLVTFTQKLCPAVFPCPL